MFSGLIFDAAGVRPVVSAVDPTIGAARATPLGPAISTIYRMATAFTRNLDQPWRTAALDELERLTGTVVPGGSGESSGELTVTSTLRDHNYTVVTVSGSISARAIRLLAAHFAGLLNAGTRHLVVDLSRVEGVDDDLLDLMRKVEARVRMLSGEFELTGLAPPVLYAMDDEPLTEVFAQYRAIFEDGRPRALLWSAVRFPQGLADVPEPGSAARCRAFIDTGAHGRGERWGRRR